MTETGISPEDRRGSGSARLAAGRQLPKLLFATSLERLRASIGAAADEATELIRSAGMELLDVGGAAAPWRTVASAAASVEGIVLLGGYDVLPSLRLDVLPAMLRRRLGHPLDLDDFLVWSDEGYGDVDGNGLPELPVSRIPDGRSGDLVMKALRGTILAPRHERFGLRNVARPFADGVYAGVPGSEAMLVSEPSTSGDLEVERLAALNLYLMLHGSNGDLASFWGESTGGAMVEALNAPQIRELDGGVVFAGCCYGGLTVEERAHEIADHEVPTVVEWDRSLALTMLARGASAFVGCTGTHYSPGVPGIFGSQVLHEAFWRHVSAGSAPARALYDAKIDYITRMPYNGDLGMVAVLLKMWRQFTCLGLGW